MQAWTEGVGASPVDQFEAAPHSPGVACELSPPGLYQVSHPAACAPPAEPNITAASEIVSDRTTRRLAVMARAPFRLSPRVVARGTAAHETINPLAALEVPAPIPT